MHVLNRVPHRFIHLQQGLVAEDPGVVDQDVEPAEAVDRFSEDAFCAGFRGHGVEAGSSLSAEGADLFHHAFCRAVVAAAAVAGTADIVDHDLGALTREQDRSCSSDAVAGTRDDRHFGI
jgi:hypothetical protein